MTGNAFGDAPWMQWLVIILTAMAAGTGGGAFLGRTQEQSLACEMLIERLERDMHKIEETVEELPPEWFREEFREVKDALGAQADRDVNMSSRIRNLEAWRERMEEDYRRHLHGGKLHKPK